MLVKISFCRSSPSQTAAVGDLLSDEIANSSLIRAYLKTKYSFTPDNVQKLQKFYKDEDSLAMCFGNAVGKASSVTCSY